MAASKRLLNAAASKHQARIHKRGPIEEKVRLRACGLGQDIERGERGAPAARGAPHTPDMGLSHA